MPHSQRPEMRELVLSPQEHVVAGGPAEELEQQIQVNYRQGVQSILVDMRAPGELKRWSERIRAEFRPVLWDQAASQFFRLLKQRSN